MVGEVFHRVAHKYDLMNDLMSGGIHRIWKDSFVRMLSPWPRMKHLDVAGGTGDIAFRCLDAIAAQSPVPALSSPTEAPASAVTVCDINQSMLDVGKDRARERGYLRPDGTAPAGAPALDFVLGDAQKLPFEDNTFDSYTIAFGLRNVTDVDLALREALRVLKPGGRYLCLEFSKVDTPLLREAYDLYSFNVIPLIGQFVVQDRSSYQYLVESIRKFPDQPTLAQKMRDAGFTQVSFNNMLYGVTAVHSGFKP